MHEQKYKEKCKCYYKLNPLHYNYGDLIYFQIEGNRGIKVKYNTLIADLSAGSLSYEQVQNLVRKSEFNGDVIDDLLSLNILIPEDEYQKRVVQILDDFWGLLSCKDKSTKLNTIFVCSPLYGYRIVSVIKAAVVLKKKFKIYRDSTSDMCVLIDDCYTFDNRCDNNFHENPISIEITKSKNLTSSFLRSKNINTPKQCILDVNDMEGILNFVHRVGFPVCIKPDDMTESIDVFPNINSNSELLGLVDYMHDRYEKIVLEQHITGNVYRLYYCYGALRIAVNKSNRYIIGDGKSTISELVNLKYSYKDIQMHYADIVRTISKNHFEMSSVLDNGVKIPINTACNEEEFNVITSDNIDPQYYTWLERIADIIGMHCFAADVIADTLKIYEKPYVIELQECPEFNPNDPIADVFYLEIVRNLTAHNNVHPV